MYASSRISVAHLSQFGGEIRGIRASRVQMTRAQAEPAADDLK
jgi:hypothetical protein